MSPEFEPDSETQQCPVCHSTYPVGVAVCAFCGSPLPMAQAVGAALHPPLPVPILPGPIETPEMAETSATPAASLAAVQDTAPPQAAAVEPRWCAFCGWGSPPEAERCIVCGAALPVHKAQADQRALLELQLEQARAHAAVNEADERRAGRWRWAAWGISRLWRST